MPIFMKKDLATKKSDGMSRYKSCVGFGRNRLEKLKRDESKDDTLYS